jgi:hypothetical protein
MADNQLLRTRMTHDFIEIDAVGDDVTFFKKYDQKQIKEAIQELETIIDELKRYVVDEKQDDGS